MTTLRISTKLIEKQDQEVDSVKVCLFVKVVDCGSLCTQCTLKHTVDLVCRATSTTTWTSMQGLKGGCSQGVKAR